MNYTLNQLQIFLKVVENQSVTKASEKLNLTQPAVSIQLKNFQDQFDIPLTEVIGRKIFITDFGREVAAVAENILKEAETIQFKTMAYKGQLSGRLKISVVSTGKYVMPYFLSDFISNNPGVELSLDVTNKIKVVESLEKNEVDFALVSIIPANLNCDKIELLENRIHLIGNPGHKLKKEKDGSFSFKELPLIFREKGSGTRQIMERFLERNDFSIVKKMELTSNEAVKQSVLAGLGYSIMSLIGLKNELQNKQLKIIPVKGLPIKNTWNLIWLKGKKFSPLSKALIEYLNKEKERIKKEKFDWYDQFK
jgi:DNA-binding transcriptional LysR family regulator